MGLYVKSERCTILDRVVQYECKKQNNKRGIDMPTNLTCRTEREDHHNLVVNFSDTLPGDLYDTIEAGVRKICAGFRVMFYWATAGDRLRINLPRNVPADVMCALVQWVVGFKFHSN